MISWTITCIESTAWGALRTPNCTYTVHTLAFPLEGTKLNKAQQSSIQLEQIRHPIVASPLISTPVSTHWLSSRGPLHPPLRCPRHPAERFPPSLAKTPTPTRPIRSMVLVTATAIPDPRQLWGWSSLSGGSSSTLPSSGSRSVTALATATATASQPQPRAGDGDVDAVAEASLVVHAQEPRRAVAGSPAPRRDI